jgi:hypothetical protein
VQPVDHPRCGTHRVESAERVGDEVRMHVSITAYGAPNLRLRLSSRSPSRRRPADWRHRPVGTCADDITSTSRGSSYLTSRGTQSIGRHR